MTVAEDAVFRAFTAKLEALAAVPLPAPELLRKALTHASAEADELKNNERLEFLGDSALGLAVTHLLFDALPSAREGDLTERRAHLVSRRTAASVARRLGLHEIVATGRSLGGRVALPPAWWCASTGWRSSPASWARRCRTIPARRTSKQPRLDSPTSRVTSRWSRARPRPSTSTSAWGLWAWAAVAVLLHRRVAGAGARCAFSGWAPAPSGWP